MQGGLYKEMKESFRNSELITKVIYVFAGLALLFWLLIMLASIFYWSNGGIDKLGQVGDSFNIGTSLFAAFTVCLVAYSVHIQRQELQGMRKELEENQKILREQLSISKEERTAEMTLKLAEEWVSIINDKNFNISQGGKNIALDFILKIVFYKNSKSLSSKIDFEVIRSLIIESNTSLNLTGIFRDNDGAFASSYTKTHLKMMGAFIIGDLPISLTP